MKDTGKYNFIFKVVPVIIAFTCLLLLPVISFAQTGGTGPVPCDPNGIPGDPGDGGDCPLDTWIVLLAFIAIVFAARHLYRKQKQSSPDLQSR